MPKQDNKVAWKVSELEKKFLSLEGEAEVMRREDKARERRITDLELRNSRLEDCVQQFGKNITARAPLHNHIVLTANKLAEEKLPSFRDGSPLKPLVSLKDDFLEILDCCLSHEERVTEVEKKCEDNHQNIRLLLYGQY